MYIIEKDITELVPPFIIMHVANNKGVMGAGVAKAISDRWPEVKADYLECPEYELGDVIVSSVDKDGFVATMIAQDGYGRDGKCYLKYDALKECIDQVIRIRQLMDRDEKPMLFLPFGMGCGLAGGNWDTVHDILSGFNVDFVIVKKG